MFAVQEGFPLRSELVTVTDVPFDADGALIWMYTPVLGIWFTSTDPPSTVADVVQLEVVDESQTEDMDVVVVVVVVVVVLIEVKFVGTIVEVLRACTDVS
jgi:hypothetical protein